MAKKKPTPSMVDDDAPAAEPEMKIMITEETGIKHEGISHMKKGEIRVVPAPLGKFFVANGWAKDVDEVEETGERGALDFENPAEWGGKSEEDRPKKGLRRTITPKDVSTGSRTE